MKILFLLLFSFSIQAQTQKLKTYDHKLVEVKKIDGFWFETKCTQLPCLSRRPIHFDFKGPYPEGEDRSKIFCQESLKGRFVALLDSKKNQWAFCELSDGSYVDASYLKSKISVEKIDTAQ